MHVELVDFTEDCVVRTCNESLSVARQISKEFDMLTASDFKIYITVSVNGEKKKTNHEKPVERSHIEREKSRPIDLLPIVYKH